MSELLEALAFACLAAFAYFIWPPAALIPVAIYFYLASMATETFRIRDLFRKDKSNNEPE